MLGIAMRTVRFCGSSEECAIMLAWAASISSRSIAGQIRNSRRQTADGGRSAILLACYFLVDGKALLASVIGAISRIRVICMNHRRDGYVAWSAPGSPGQPDLSDAEERHSAERLKAHAQKSQWRCLI